MKRFIGTFTFETVTIKKRKATHLLLYLFFFRPVGDLRLTKKNSYHIHFSYDKRNCGFDWPSLITDRKLMKKYFP